MEQLDWQDPKLASAMLTNMNGYRATGEFCDVTLVVGENPSEEIKAHRLVLSSFSRYFEGLLKPNMKEGNQHRIEIHSLSGPVVQELIDFAYTGKLKITTENIESIFEAANFLAIDSACTGCCDFMKKNMDRSNCIGVLRCAELYGQKKLRNSAFDMVLKNLAGVVEGDEFYGLPAETVREIISSEDLPLKGFKVDEHEKLILDTVVKYLQKNHLEGSSDAVLLFEHVRLPLLEKSVVVNLQNSELVSKNQNLKELVESRSTVPARHAIDKTAEPWMRPRLCQGLREMATKKYGVHYHYDNPQTFTDKEQGKDSYIQGMKVFVRNWDGRPSIGGMEVVYASGERTVHGAPKEGGEVHEFTLGDNERIVDVALNSGWLIDKIGFITSENERKIGPFGGHGGSERTIRKPTAEQNGFLKYVSGVIGHSQGGTVLGGLRLHFGYYDYDDNDADIDNDGRYDSDSVDSFNDSDGYDSEDHY